LQQSVGHHLLGLVCLLLVLLQERQLAMLQERQQQVLGQLQPEQPLASGP